MDEARDLVDPGIPLVASVESEDSKLKNWVIVHGPQFDVLLDGVPITRVIAYDVIEGSLLRFVTDAENRIQLTADRKDAKRETLRGRVEVRWQARDGR